MIKAAIFDLVGTLLNRDASVRKFLLNQYERLNNWLGDMLVDSDFTIQEL